MGRSRLEREVLMGAHEGSEHAGRAEERGICDTTLEQFRADVIRLSHVDEGDTFPRSWKCGECAAGCTTYSTGGCGHAMRPRPARHARPAGNSGTPPAPPLVSPALRSPPREPRPAPASSPATAPGPSVSGMGAAQHGNLVPQHEQFDILGRR